MIEVGEYVRTRKGIIGRLRGQYIYENNGVEYPEPQEWVIDRFNTGKNYYVTNEADCDFDEITKHSKNLIDLIEPGDYVNGKEILEVRQNTENGLRYLMYDYVPIKYYVERTDKIKSILTHEQFEQIKYKVKEN